jgi:hypothetical protein
MIQRSFFCLILLALASHWRNGGGGVTAEVYTAGSTKADVTIDYLDDYGTNKKCVKFTAGAPDEKWDTACFTSFYTDGKTFRGCEVTFGSEKCNKCDACEDDNEKVGFAIDCFNIQPEESTTSCVILNNTYIQKVLVDDVFGSQAFAFTDNTTIEPTKQVAPSKGPFSNGASLPLAATYAVVCATVSVLLLAM